MSCYVTRIPRTRHYGATVQDCCVGVGVVNLLKTQGNQDAPFERYQDLRGTLTQSFTVVGKDSVQVLSQAPKFDLTKGLICDMIKLKKEGRIQ